MDNIKHDDAPVFVADEFNNREQDVDEIEISESADDEQVVDADSEEGTPSIATADVAPEYEKLIYVVPEPEGPDILSKFEMTQLVSIRIGQIAKYSNCFTDTQGLTTATEMAQRELMMRKCPLTLKRYLGDRMLANGLLQKCYEYRDPNGMLFAVTY